MGLLKKIYKKLKKPVEWIEIPLPFYKPEKEDKKKSEEE